MMNQQILDQVKNLPDLKGVPVNQIEWLVSISKHQVLEAGDFLYKQGDPIDHTNFIVSGKLFIYRLNEQQERVDFGEFSAPTISGWLPYSRGEIAMGNGRVVEKMESVSLPKTYFQEMVTNHFELVQALVHVMTNRVRSFTTEVIQNEKLIALGKLSAGLAHELNNPASAVVRGAKTLRDRLRNTPEGFKKVISLKLSETTVDSINKILFHQIDQGVTSLSMMEKSEQEDDIADWLEQTGLDDGYELAETLVEYGFTVETMEKIYGLLKPHEFLPIMHWITDLLITEKTVEDVKVASERMADLIQSIKYYSHMDQSKDMQQVDIQSGLENTLKVLAHKIKGNNIQLKVSYAPNPLYVNGFPGEINQAFTNVIDNAIDALENTPNPLLEIHVFVEGEFTRIDISDNGPGIPKETQRRVFEPFFTTKGVGKGTGMGLDLTNRIIKKHRGKISLNSEKGKTTFKICIPSSTD